MSLHQEVYHWVHVCLPFPWILHQDLLLGSPQVTSLYLHLFPPTVRYVIRSFHIHHCLAPMVPRASASRHQPIFLFSIFHTTLAPTVASLLHKPPVIGPGYSPIPERLDTKIKAGQFVDPADLLPQNVKGHNCKPQTYLDGKLLV